ncbi:unnamed protein product [Peronospora destructor]|uniref:Uncharacterized protein n=1 Tax=Peronospora destructor TaxID=86335 RepID=A0AAV0V3C0_9STRA|nr:unnamed protein product [Peronospora destructor]
MSVALWYYCNLADDMKASDVVSFVQIRRSVVQVNANTVRPTASLALRAVVDDELAVERSTYVLTASVAAAEVERAATEPMETETVKVEAVALVVSPVEKTVAHRVTVEAEVQESLSEVDTVVEVKDVDVIVAKEEKPASLDDVAVALEEMDSERVASNVLAFASRGKVLDKTEDVMLDAIAEPEKRFTRIASIPEDKENFVGVAKESGKTAYMVDHVNAASVEKAMEVVEVVEASSTTKVIAAIIATDDESETETQSKMLETPAIEKIEAAAVAKVNEAPEFEIDETMVIDPDVAAKEAAAIEAQTSSFSFIPEHIRNNSYAVSSVALAVTTAITAALLARR